MPIKKQTKSKEPTEFRTQDRGQRGFKMHKAEKHGEIMAIAEKNVITTQASNSIKNVAKLMKNHDFRRIPVTDAGTNRLEGMAVAIDIIDFLGGGEKYNIILKDYNGNFLSAINCPISKIMNPYPSFVDKMASVGDVIKIMLSKHTSSIPIVEDTGGRKIIGIVTERDLLPVADNFGIAVKEAMQKKCITSSPGIMISDVAKIMVRNRLRRLPVIEDDNIIGIITVFDILNFLGYGEFRGVDAEEILSTRAGEIMSKNVVSLRPEQDIAEVSKLVKTTGMGGFPVVGKGGLLGIITTSDVIREVYRNGS